MPSRVTFHTDTVYIYLSIYIYIYIHQAIGLMMSVLSNGLCDQGLIPGWILQKTQKRVLDPTLLNSIIKYGSRVKWSNPGNREVRSLTPIEKGAFGSPSTTVTNLYIYIYICIKGCCFLAFFKIAHSILVPFPSSFFFMHFVSVHIVHPLTSYLEKPSK